MAAKYTEDDIRRICTEHGHTYVRGYTNADNKFDCICSCGKPWSTMLGTIKRGGACHGGSDKIIPHKHTEQDIIDICAEYGHKYINGWINAQTKFNCICSCGEEWLTLLGNIHRGSSCRVCSGYMKLTHTTVVEELVSYGLYLLKPYVNSAVKLTYQCTCGNIGNTHLNHIRKGVRCGKCNYAENKWRDYFTKYGCEIISYRKAISIVYLCRCGEINMTQASLFKSGRQECPKCRTRRDYKSSTEPINRLGLRQWKKSVVIRDNYECQICNIDEGLEIHHIEAYSVRPDLISDIDNGITVCYDCHKKLHSKYGKQVGRENLEKELYNENCTA
jgi:5-methylcytosine-specific restriction endonuclease McrA